MVLAATDRGLCGVWFVDQKYAPDTHEWVRYDNHPLLARSRDELEAFFAGETFRFDLPLDLHAGTDFQQAVWKALLQIPWGQTLSYGELARRIGRPRSVRAAAAAIGRNPISIVVPCHRVLGSDGSLTGYAGGVQRKAALLAIEGVYPGPESRLLSRGLPKRRDAVTA